MDQESTILESDTGEFLLTDRKVRYEIKKLGQLNVTSILLDKITSLEIKFKSNYFFLGFTALAFLFSFVSKFEYAPTIGIIVGIVFILLYYRSIEKVIKVSSPTTSISLSVKNLSNDEAIEFIDEVEKAASKI